MIGKKIVLLLLLAFLTFCAMPAMAFEVESLSEEEALAALGAEPSLTQADIDALIKNASALEKASAAEDEDAYMQLIKEIGWTEIRAAYIPIKTATAWAFSQEPETAAIIQALFPPEMMPRPEEQALVEKNIDKLAPIFAEE